MVVSYLEIGRAIVEYGQKGNIKAEYGDSTIKRLSKDLSDIYGNGFSLSNITKMRKLYGRMI